MFLSVDLYLFRMINQIWVHPAGDWFFPFITEAKTWVPVWIILILLLLIRGKRKGQTAILLIIISVGLTDFTAAKIIKPGAKRIRPSRLLREYTPLRDKMDNYLVQVENDTALIPEQNDSLIFLQHKIRALEDSLALTPEKIRALAHIRILDGYGGRWSFPSNHAANFAAIAFVFTFFYRKLRFIPWIIVFLVAYSRVYVGRHYPADVVFGVIYGIFLAWIVCSLWQYLLYRKTLRKLKGVEKTP